MPREIRAVQIDLGRRVRELRSERGLSQEAIATKANMLTPNYARIERGMLNVTLDSLVRIANALEVEPLELLRPPMAEREAKAYAGMQQRGKDAERATLTESTTARRPPGSRRRTDR